MLRVSNSYNQNLCKSIIAEYQKFTSYWFNVYDQDDDADDQDDVEDEDEDDDNDADDQDDDDDDDLFP